MLRHAEHILFLKLTQFTVWLDCRRTNDSHLYYQSFMSEVGEAFYSVWRLPHMPRLLWFVLT